MEAVGVTPATSEVVAGGEAAADDEDEWTTVSSRKKDRSSGRRGGGGVTERSGGVQATKTIHKKPQYNAPGPPPSTAPPARRLVGGLPLTRSRSERARLLALADSVMNSNETAAAAEATEGRTMMAAPPGLGCAVEVRAPPGLMPAGLPFTRSAASQLDLDLDEIVLLANVPLTRSAASNLALDMAEGMML